MYKFAFCFFAAFSMASPALLMRVVASAYSVAEKAATIVRNVMAAGDLGIVEKVLLLLRSSLMSLINAELDTGQSGNFEDQQLGREIQSMQVVQPYFSDKRNIPY